MTRFVVPLAVALLALAGCGESDAENAMKFAEACRRAEFSADQCLFLSAMSKQASSEASSAAMIGAFGVGLASTSGGRR